MNLPYAYPQENGMGILLTLKSPLLPGSIVIPDQCFVVDRFYYNLLLSI